jgi:hypothetical protein
MRRLVCGRAVTSLGAPIPFQATSGQYNFGCEQTSNAQVMWKIRPDSGIEGLVTSKWMNIDNVGAADSSVVVVDGAIVGTGKITGRNFERLPFGISNCPGGNTLTQ